MPTFIPQGLGWIPDLPDPRDYTYQHEAVQPLLEQLQNSEPNNPPDEVDLRQDEEGEYFSDAYAQGSLNCSTALAILGLVEYFERRIHGRTFEGSGRFLYKTTRNRRNKQHTVTGDTGADLRATVKTLVSTGVPPEEHWPCDIKRFDEEPSSFIYSLAKPLSDVIYFRLDEPNRDGQAVWEILISFLAAGFPVAFGFSVPTSLTNDSDIPYRRDLDGIRGGQAVIAVGYKKHLYGRGQHALLVRSSWGSEWGDNGNGWLPIGFIHRQLARDFWTLISPEWLGSGELSKPYVVDARPKKE